LSVLPAREPPAPTVPSSDDTPLLTYPDAVAALVARGRFGIRLGLGRTRALLGALGDPQVAIRGALIAGTNGKGSVQALVSAMLAAAGYRVGQAPKPHLVDYRERIVVAGDPIAPDDLARLVERVLAQAARVPRRLGPPTEFELLTAAAFAWFAERRVDLAVVEVGLGGRLDATNAWDGGVAAVTNVAMDHADLLGDTIPRIAREKAAIVKRGDRAVTGAIGEARAVVRRRARRLGVPLTEVEPLPVVGMDRHGLRVEVPGLGEVHMGMLGRHQAANAAVALGVVDALEAAGIARVPAGARRDGLERARWPGRLELLGVSAGGAGGSPARARSTIDVLLDGAHNPDGVGALLDALDELRPWLAPGPLTAIVGIMRDKDVDGMLDRLAPSRALADARVLTVQIGARGMGAPELAERARAAWARSGGHLAGVYAAPGMGEALDMALEQAAQVGGPVVVAGSLYLVGAVRSRLMARGVLR
jgi:dihydrofolate synthase / folylpolyglutamate synthase